MKIIHFTSGPVKTNSYLIIDDKTKNALIIDPAFAGKRIIAETQKQKAKITAIVNTHGHFDHTWDTKKVKKKFNAKILIHLFDAEKLKKPDAGFFQLPFHAGKADKLLKDKQQLKIGTLTFKIIHTPGHSKGGICLYCKKEKIIFTGDTLFKNTYGRTDLHDSNASEMTKSLQKAAQLPPKTKVYAGHGMPTTIENERKWIKKMIKKQIKKILKR